VGLIRPSQLRAVARDRRLPVDIVEKDYVLGWIFLGVVKSSVGADLALKGGTALSKVYHPGGWRLSEDLDFTFVKPSHPNSTGAKMAAELPELVDEISPGLRITLRDGPFVSGGEYLQVKFRFAGPIGSGTIKIEVTTEDPVGPLRKRILPRSGWDYPAQKVQVYSIENILAEKMRALATRGHIRDYYDVWRLSRERGVGWAETRRLFPRKCQFKGLGNVTLLDMFPPGLEKMLQPYVARGLTRLTTEKVPALPAMLEETKEAVRRKMGSSLDIS